MYYEIPKRFEKVDVIPHNSRGKTDVAEVKKILSKILSKTSTEKGKIV